MGASESPDRLADRRSELRAQLVALDGLGGEPLDHPEQVDRVLAAGDRLMDVVDVIEAGVVPRLRWVAFGLLAVAALLTVLVAFGVLPAVVLLGALLVLAAGAGLLFGIRNAPAARS